MVDALNLLLPILLYVVGIISLIVLIILGIKLIKTLDKVDRIVDNIEDKVNSLNPAFDIVSKATDTLAVVGESVIGAVGGIVAKIFRKKSKNEEDYYE